MDAANVRSAQADTLVRRTSGRSSGRGLRAHAPRGRGALRGDGGTSNEASDRAPRRSIATTGIVPDAIGLVEVLREAGRRSTCRAYSESHSSPPRSTFVTRPDTVSCRPRRDVRVGLGLRTQSGCARAPPFDPTDPAVVVEEVHDQGHVVLARTPARRVEQQHRSALEVAAHASLVGAELVDDVGVPVGHALHDSAAAGDAFAGERLADSARRSGASAPMRRTSIDLGT